MTVFKVDEPFPVKVPEQEGTYLELWESSLNLIIQYPNLMDDENEAFKKSFEKYTFVETNTPIPIPFFIFNFPTPFNPIDANFNGLIVDRKMIENFLEKETNLLTIYLIDKTILRGLKAVGLHFKAVEQFKNTIRKQLKMNYNETEFFYYLSNIYKNFTLDDLSTMGTVYKHENIK